MAVFGGLSNEATWNAKADQPRPVPRHNLNKETENKSEKINSIIKFEFIESSKSKNIDQINQEIILELLAIDLVKKNQNYEIILLFSNNAFITLSAEIIEVTLEDQKK